jgi:uncharacterized cofD-like protein
VKPPRPARVTALGGGHGLAASLRALRRLEVDLTAVVTVADDGGSSGRLRAELGALPPGDLRMALAALAGRETWAELFQHRFGGAGPLSGHAVGNLVLAGLAEVTGDPVAALDLAAGLLGAQGRVLPLTTADVDIEAHVAVDREIEVVRGQVAVARTTGRVCAVRLIPEAPPACPQAVDAVRDADAVVLGPGSLFTSVVPHLLVPQLRWALVDTAATRILTLNLVPQAGETTGFSPAAHLAALAAHAPDLRIDWVLADSSVLDRDGLMEAAKELGATVHMADVAADAGRHDPVKLATAYAHVLGRSEPAWR